MNTAPAHTVKLQIIGLLDQLPPESLELLKDFAEFLHVRGEKPYPQRPIVKLEGLWEGVAEITAEDIAEARQEMWGGFGDRDL